jgi:hypothetical protein
MYLYCFHYKYKFNDFYFKYYIAIKSPEISLEGNSDLPIK